MPRGRDGLERGWKRVDPVSVVRVVPGLAGFVGG